MRYNNGIKRDKDNHAEKYIEDIIFPLTEILGCINDLEILTVNLSRMEFFHNKDGVIEYVQEYLIRISTSLELIKESNPMIMNWLQTKYDKIPWEKYIKIGKAIDAGYWAFIYSIAWKMASQGVVDIKKVVIDLLELKSHKNQFDSEFF